MIDITGDQTKHTRQHRDHTMAAWISQVDSEPTPYQVGFVMSEMRIQNFHNV